MGRTTLIHVLQKLMGHSSIVTTHMRVGDASELEAAAGYERLLDEPVRGAESERTTDARMTPERV